MSIIKAVQAALLPRWQPQTVDLTQPGSGGTQEERDCIMRAGRAIYGVPPAPVISLENYRWQRQYLGRRPRPAAGPNGCMDPRD